MPKVIFPPRPKSAIPPTELDYYDKTGLWIAQYKYNGARAPIHIQNGQVNMCDRHGGQLRSYSMPINTEKQILALPGLDKSKEYWLDAELLIKTSAADTKQKIIFFDVLQAGNYFFLKPNQMTRLAILDEICGHPKQIDPLRGMGLSISEDLMLAPVFDKDFVTHFKEKIQFDECEGLMLRKRDSVIDNFGAKEYEIGWMVRCRKPNKNYPY